jgi:hypothetical protein
MPIRDKLKTLAESQRTPNHFVLKPELEMGKPTGNRVHHLTDVGAENYARDFTALHNQASNEYKKTFKDVGAKMWPDDRAHLLKPKHRESLVNNLKQFPWSVVKELYHIQRPLTVLDSYPNVSTSDRKKLDSAVKKIHTHHTKKLADLHNTFDSLRTR